MGKFIGSIEEFEKHDSRLKEQLNHKYGFDWISKGVTQKAFADVAKTDLSKAGFTKIRPGWYVKQSEINQDINHCIKWSEYKGAIAGLQWGISLAFLPKDWWNYNNKKLRWKRTLKSSQLDITISIRHDVIFQGEAPGQHYELFPSLSNGDYAFNKFTQSSWILQKPIVFRYFSKLNTIQSVLDFFKKEKQYFSPDYSTYTIIPESFCLARLQRCKEAKKILAEYFKDWAKKPNSQDMLEKALAMVCEKKFPSES